MFTIDLPAKERERGITTMKGQDKNRNDKEKRKIVARSRGVSKRSDEFVFVLSQETLAVLRSS